MTFISCKSGKTVGENPFFAEWETPYGVPPFDKIEPEHFLPATERGHVAARGRDRRHHVEQRRADVRERHPRLRRFGKDAFAGRADLRDALRRGEHLRNAGAGGADYAPDGRRTPTRSVSTGNFSNGSKPSTTVAPRWDSTPSRAVCWRRPTAVSCAPERCSTPSGRRV